MSTKGETRWPAPPDTSLSASMSAWRSSKRLNPPIMQARNSPSGARMRRTCAKTPGRSSTHCSARPETTRSSEALAKGRASSSATRRKSLFLARPARARRAAAPDASASRAPARNARSACRDRARAGKSRLIAERRSSRSSAARAIRNSGAPLSSARASRRRKSLRSKRRGGAFCMSQKLVLRGAGGVRPKRCCEGATLYENLGLPANRARIFVSTEV